MSADRTPADTWAELLAAVTHPDQQPWARTLEPVIALAAADPVLSRLFVEAAWDEIHVSVDSPVDDEGRLPWLWPEAAGFELRHGLRRSTDRSGEESYVIVGRPTASDDRGEEEALTAPLQEDRWEAEWDRLRRRWDQRALADPRFMVVDPAEAEPLGRYLTPDDAVALWSAAVARVLGAED